MDTKGGTDGEVIRVTNLKPEGPGSLRAALEAEGKRLVVFDVAGVIELDREIAVDEPYVTVAGQTAPSSGITIIKGEILIRTHDVIMQHLRVRLGDKASTEGSGDAMRTSGPDVYNVLIDHCSLTWSTDENLSASGPRLEGPAGTSQRVTFSNNIIAEGLLPHSCGSLIHDFVREVAIIGNLYAHNGGRNPRVLEGSYQRRGCQ